MKTFNVAESDQESIEIGEKSSSIYIDKIFEVREWEWNTGIYCCHLGKNKK